MSQAPLLSVSHLSYAYGRRRKNESIVLHDVSFVVEAGDFVTILGPNGAGKSTLLKCLNRILPYDQGSVVLNGRSLALYSMRELAQLISYVPQGDYRHVDFPVHEFIAMSRYAHRRGFFTLGTDDRRSIDEAIDCVGLSDFRDRRLSELSAGESQKVAIAAALAQEAPLMLLDEPCTFLDPRHQQEILSLLCHLNGSKKITIVQVSHDFNFSSLPSTKIIGLKKGKIIFDDKREGIITPESLKQLYDTEFHCFDHPQDKSALAIQHLSMGEQSQNQEKVKNV